MRASTASIILTFCAALVAAAPLPQGGLELNSRSFAVDLSKSFCSFESVRSSEQILTIFKTDTRSPDIANLARDVGPAVESNSGGTSGAGGAAGHGAALSKTNHAREEGSEEVEERDVGPATQSNNGGMSVHFTTLEIHPIKMLNL